MGQIIYDSLAKSHEPGHCEKRSDEAI